MLHLACLYSLALFFTSHSPPYLDPHSALLRSLGERNPGVASETFRVFSALLNGLKPIKAGGEWPEAVYEQAVARTDAEVHVCTEMCIGDLWMCATDVLYVRCRRSATGGVRSAGTSDSPLQSRALSLLALVLELAPTATFSEIENDLLPDVYRIAHWPLVPGAALDSLLSL
ncbi:hypothetical protein B0H11DRAFT_2216073 [Mycena galericulata]|nr:hypothetical protein B0H11DRAFT_2216073 [Mycena galericulata]